MDEPTALPLKASLAGLQGVIVGASDAKLQWEIEVPTAQLHDLIRTLGTGEPLACVTNEGLVTVKTRDWLVWPGESTVRLRLALEEASAW